ncbi:hypothetical protein [Paraburkholderia ferrariae]|uniref:hypothetical protein n=1 Tax=Paraburkholderia ferrariae TaxID=386056 RepID=UPI00069428D4|nr:hypothetical protein [Paraburkholderia ferrariae]
MADIADNADPTFPSTARVARGAPPKRRASAAAAIPTDTENTRAQAAEPPGAQPAEPTRDESTFDLFGDDPAYTATPLVRAPDARRAREALSAVPAQQPVVAPAEAEPAQPLVATAAPDAEVATEVRPAPTAVAPRRSTRTKAATLAAALGEPALQAPESTAANDIKPDDGPGAPPAAAAEIADTGPQIAPALPPEPESARTHALAQAVDALHGRIADQGRAAAELSRRMKWTLAAAAGALLVTVATGIVQTVALVRLASETRAQQQHLAQMMQDQQAALAGALARLAAQPVAAPPPAPALQAAAVRAAPAHPARHAAAHAHHARPASQARGH